MNKIKSIDDVYQKEIAKNELKMLNIGYSMGKFLVTTHLSHRKLPFRDGSIAQNQIHKAIFHTHLTY